MDKYKKSIDLWNNLYSKEYGSFPQNKKSGNTSFDSGLQWLTDKAEIILDFGCGNGTTLFLCSHYGTRKFIGIDLAEEAIKTAKKRSKMDSKSKYDFKFGGIDRLAEIKSNSVDAVIVSNVIDNLYPNDACLLLQEVFRILKKDGKLLVKLNPFLSDDQIEEYTIKRIDKNLLDDGMLLWNNTTKEWDELFEDQFQILHYEEIYYDEYDQYNRMYWLKKTSD